MLRTTYRGRAVREPEARSIHDDEAEAPERFFCAEGCGEEVGVEGETCACCLDLAADEDAGPYDTRDESALEV